MPSRKSLRAGMPMLGKETVGYCVHCRQMTRQAIIEEPGNRPLRWCLNCFVPWEAHDGAGLPTHPDGGNENGGSS
jgi:hypothetical protein